MSIAIVTGSAGLIGSAAARMFTSKGMQVVGIDNNMRAHFFGPKGSTDNTRQQLVNELNNYQHESADIRDSGQIGKIFSRYKSDIKIIIHTAAQPSHDWASKDPTLDFSINALGTLNLLEQTRTHCPDAAFIFFSTNKVYGDTPNKLPLKELDLRWELDTKHPYYTYGVNESMSIDQCTHSLFGVSKASADLLVQEYGRYFGMKTMCLRGGCLTGSAHAAVEIHGFLSYLVQCALADNHYTVYGYKGKQVRDNIHCTDVANLLWHMSQNPRSGEVYNVGGSRHSNCSVLEAIKLCESHTNRPMSYSYNDKNRIGDHMWWISDVRKLQSHFPEWQYQYNIEKIIDEIYNTLSEKKG